jgi:hypothetical protein
MAFADSIEGAHGHSPAHEGWRQLMAGRGGCIILSLIVSVLQIKAVSPEVQADFLNMLYWQFAE